MREIWFQRAAIGGWYPINKKGYVLLLGGVSSFLLLIFGVLFAAEHHWPTVVTSILAACALAVWAAVMVISFLHSRPWHSCQ